MKKIRSFLLTLFFASSALAQDQDLKQATDAQVQNGADVKRWINPRQYQQFMGTNGGGGAALGSVTQVLNSATGVLKTNGDSLTFNFSPTGTNDIQNIATPVSQNTANNTSNALYSTFSLGASGFVTLILSNATTANIQATINGMTNGGVLSIQPATYNITAPILITNSIYIQGNGATFVYAVGLTNYMLDTGTNFGKPITVQDLNVSGGTFAPFGGSAYFFGAADYRPWTTALWTNRTGMRLEGSGGLVVRGCRFTGWSGNGLLLLNKFNVFATSSPRAFVINNIFATNFVGLMAPGANYDTPGYNNSDSSTWNELEAEYTQVIDNQFWANQQAANVTAGNCTVLGNIMTSNYTAIVLNTGTGNAAHGNYSYNNLNHNQHPIFCDNVGNAGNFEGNMMLQSGSVVFRGSQGIYFSQNKIQFLDLTFTNGCQGTVAFNNFGGKWGVDVTTNFTASPALKVYGNIDENGQVHDGSMLSVFDFATNAPFAGAFPYTPDGTNAAWTLNPSFNQVTASSVVGNGSGLTNIPFTALAFSGVKTNAFTNNLIGYLPFTNVDGRVCAFLVVTNLP